MYRREAARHSAESNANADQNDLRDDNGFSASTWIPEDAPTNPADAAPLACEILAEIENRIDGLTSQLETSDRRQQDGKATDVPNLDYLIEQFRIITFTIGGTLSRQMMANAGRIPAGQLQSIRERFINLSDQLRALFEDDQKRQDCAAEIQRQTQSISRKLAIVIDRLYGNHASDFLDDIETTLNALDAIADQRRSATRHDIVRLGQRLCETLAQFEDAVRKNDQYAECSERFQQLSVHGSRTLESLVDRPNNSEHADVMRIHIRFEFAATQIAIRGNDAAMPRRTVS